MSEVTIIGIDLAKRVFQLHGARQDGSVVFRKKLSSNCIFQVWRGSHSRRLLHRALAMMTSLRATAVTMTL